MKKYVGLIGIILLIFSAILPIAKLNDASITILPFFNNFDLQGGLWQWRDISAFAVTYPIILIISLIFFLKGKVKVVLPLLGIIFFIAFFILVSVWMTNTKLEDFPGNVLSLSYGWLVMLIGFIMAIVGSIPEKKE